MDMISSAINVTGTLAQLSMSTWVQALKYSIQNQWAQYYQLSMSTQHPRLSRVKSIRFHLLEIKRVLVLYFNNLLPYGFIYTILFPSKCICQQIVFNELNCDRKSQLSGILTEPLNPHNRHKLSYQCKINGHNLSSHVSTWTKLLLSL